MREMIDGINFSFFEPRFEMTHAGRLFVRVVFFSGCVILAAAGATFLLSDVQWLLWTGALLFIFLLDSLKHFGQANRSLYKLHQKSIPAQANLADYLTPATFVILEYAFDRALLGGNFDLFLLKRLLSRKDIQAGIERMDLNFKEIRDKADELLRESIEDKKYIVEGIGVKLKEEMEKILRLALEQAVIADGQFIEPKDLFAALSYCDSAAVLRILQLFNIDAGDLRNALIFSRYKGAFSWRRRLPVTIGGFAYHPYKIRHRIMNRAWSARTTSLLDQFGQDLTDLARTGYSGFLIGHSVEYDRMVDVLARPGRPNVLLVGEPGAGKETLVNHLAFKITKDEVPPELFDKRLISLQIGSLMPGTERGELQAQLNKIIEEIVRAGNIILYIPDIHNLTKTSGRSNINAADILLPAVSSSAFSVIGTTYPKEYKQAIEPQTDFAKVFETVRVEEISIEDALRLLVYSSIILERQFKITITFGAIKQAVSLAAKYFRDKLLPSSAEDLLKEALSDAKDKGDKVLNIDDVIDIAQRRVNIPLRHAKSVEAEKLLNLEQLIHERLIDQEEAVKAVSRSLREYRSGLSRVGGPIATFLFVGPTGVGKTELSKILANIQFGSKDAMIRFDMSEYQDKQSVFRFIGAPDGSSSGALTEAAIRQPYSLILLDEFEKAHPDILNLFLQVFDDGRLTDNVGHTVDFQNTVIIATSNANSNFIKESLESGKNMSEVSEELKKKLTEYFRPELLNRFSGIIVFRGLSPEDIVAVAGILLKDLAEEINKNLGIIIDFSEEVIRKIAEWGYDPVFGARPLRGVISDKIRSVLAEKILKNEIGKGGNISVKLENNELVFYEDKDKY